MRRNTKTKIAAGYRRRFQQKSWIALRVKVLRRSAGRCEKCGRPAPLQVHHRTYRRFGREKLSDVLAVCARCHQRIHRRKF